MKHVIIGAGAAGITAAKTIRENRENDEIVIVSTDTSVYSRCMLHKYISDKRSEAELSFIPDDFFEKNKIRWISGVTVTNIDTSAKKVVFENGSESYDTLLIASGAESLFPPIEGMQGAKNVIGLRDFPDAKTIRKTAASVENIVIIGAGLVGLDAAYALIEMGKKPIVVEMADTVLPVNLDSYAASLYQEKFEAAGCSFRLGKGVCGVSSDANGAVSAVALNDGESIKCELLIVAAGIRPNVSNLKDSGIALENGVKVNEYLATSAADVYAAGDVAGLTRNWSDAVKQGEVAALNMCGIPTHYSVTTAGKNTINFFGLVSLSIGKLTAEGDDFEYCCKAKDKYEKFIISNDILAGVILMGDISHSGHWQSIIENKVNISAINKPIWKITYADFFALAPNGQYQW